MIIRKYAIHVHGPTLEKNRNEGTNLPVVVVRRRSHPAAMIFCRSVDVIGPCNFVHEPSDPLPGTNGRAVCWVETDGPLYIHYDDDSEALI